MLLFSTIMATIPEEKIKLFLEGRITWGVITLILAAIAYSGRVTVTISYILLTVAFLIGSFQIFRSDLGSRIRIVFCVVFGVGILLVTWWIHPEPSRDMIPRPNFSIANPELITATPGFKSEFGSNTEYVVQIKVTNVGTHTATNIHYKWIIVDQLFNFKPNIEDGSKANDCSPNMVCTYSVGFICIPTVPSYFIFAIRYEDKDISLSSKFPRISSYKFSGNLTELPLQFNDTSIPEYRELIDRFKQELKDYQE
jgi:hypothetical protein